MPEWMWWMFGAVVVFWVAVMALNWWLAKSEERP